MYLNGDVVWFLKFRAAGTQNAWQDGGWGWTSAYDATTKTWEELFESPTSTPDQAWPWLTDSGREWFVSVDTSRTAPANPLKKIVITRVSANGILPTSWIAAKVAPLLNRYHAPRVYKITATQGSTTWVGYVEVGMATNGVLREKYYFSGSLPWPKAATGGAAEITWVITPTSDTPTTLQYEYDVRIA